MPKSPTTSPSTPKLSDLAREVVAPKGVVSTGWPRVEKKCGELGITFRPWQPDVGRLILAKRADGKYAATIGGTGLSIPRQVGKTFLVGAIVFALCLLYPNLTVIWTAHRVRTAEETFGKMQAFARRRRIAPYILRVVLGSGDEAVLFRNGSRILFGARESGFGLGFDELDVLIFDEAQRLRDMTLDDMIPATNQSRQAAGALLLFMGTPPRPTDPGDVFARMRAEALSGEDDDTGWVEFGADDGFVPTALPAPLTEADWRQVAKANPSYPLDTPREAILRMRKKLGPDSFLREGLGIWDKEGSVGLFGDRWAAAKHLDFPAPTALGAAFDLDRSRASISAAGKLPDGRDIIGSVGSWDGTDWALGEVARIALDQGIPVGIDEKGPASDLIDPLRGLGVTVVTTRTEDYIEACTAVDAGLESGSLTHAATVDLDDAERVAMWRLIGDRRVFGRKRSDISSLEAAALALWATTQSADPWEVWT